MIYKEIASAAQFRDAFERMGRGKQFSPGALDALYDYLNDCGCDVELDVIALCCEYRELNLSDVRDEVDEARDVYDGAYKERIDYDDDAASAEIDACVAQIEWMRSHYDAVAIIDDDDVTQTTALVHAI